MGSSKRVSAPPAGSFQDLEEQYAQPSDWSAIASDKFVPFLHHITEGCSVLDINPASCVPLWLSRKRIENAIRRLITILGGSSNDNQSVFGLTGMVAGTPTSVVVPLVGELSYLVDEYLEELHGSKEDVECEKHAHEVWYGIIDGCHFHGALMKLREMSPARWESTKWKVFCVRPGLDLTEYRKLAVVQNERNKQMYHFEPTFYDMLQSLRSIYDKLHRDRLKTSRLGSRGVFIHHRDVAHNYDGGDHNKNTTVRQAVSVATRLSMKTIAAIGSVANMNCVDIILSNSRLNEQT